ncbi:hypothetical protein X801_03288, partial [Opisthorchis viverrini]
TKKDHAPVYRKHLRKDCKTFKTTLNNSNALTYMRESFQNWPFQVMLAAPFAVDTFYLMSGLLTFYLAASRFEAVQEGCLPCIKFWFVHAVHRFLRLTPPYLLVVFIYAGLFPHLYDGPLFPQRIELTDVNYCRQHWWITYFSNFFYTKEQCLPWTWYLANEFQFSGFLAPVFITVTKWTSFDLLLVKPYTHWGTYTMGLFFGWILFKRKQQGTLRRNSRREQLFVVSALALVSTFCLSSLYGFGGATSTSGPHSLSKFTFTLNTALSRPAFALALAIVIYLCGTDNARELSFLSITLVELDGIRKLNCALVHLPCVRPRRQTTARNVSLVLSSLIPISPQHIAYFNAFLSWPGFRLPSQLTYGLSLIHPIYVYLILMRLQTPITLSSATLVRRFSGGHLLIQIYFQHVILFVAVSVISFISSFFLFLVTEIPVRTLEQFYGRR